MTANVYTTAGDALRILDKWREILTGLKEKGRVCCVQGYGVDIQGAQVIDVEDLIVILETPSRLTVNSGFNRTMAQRHFVEIAAIRAISRELDADDANPT